VLEISVLMAQFPSPEIALRSFKYRTLGLGYANLGTYFMVRGHPLRLRRRGRDLRRITALMTGACYATSAELARELGPFAGYAGNRDAMLRVIRNHRRAAYGRPRAEYEGLSIAPRGIDQHLPQLPA
jgi:ribonucleoside-diphosphate reductase alpha chain